MSFITYKKRRNKVEIPTASIYNIHPSLVTHKLLLPLLTNRNPYQPNQPYPPLHSDRSKHSPSPKPLFLSTERSTLRPNVRPISRPQSISSMRLSRFPYKEECKVSLNNQEKLLLDKLPNEVYGFVMKKELRRSVAERRSKSAFRTRDLEMLNLSPISRNRDFCCETPKHHDEQLTAAQLFMLLDTSTN